MERLATDVVIMVVVGRVREVLQGEKGVRERLDGVQEEIEMEWGDEVREGVEIMLKKFGSKQPLEIL